MVLYSSPPQKEPSLSSISFLSFNNVANSFSAVSFSSSSLAVSMVYSDWITGCCAEGTKPGSVMVSVCSCFFKIPVTDGSGCAMSLAGLIGCFDKWRMRKRPPVTIEARMMNTNIIVMEVIRKERFESGGSLFLRTSRGVMISTPKSEASLP